MGEKISEFFFGRVVLEGPWCFAWRFMEIFVVGAVITGVVHQFGG